MANTQEGYNPNEFYSDANTKVRDIEEKQNILRERLLMIGKNMIESREETSRKMLEIKKDIEKMKQDLERIKSFIETISNEFSKFAKKDDVEILSKQIKMSRAFM
ncbi:hypothetical protein J4407_02305 [Candidatus Pacearchaeota archaeon]|nr:hypothetical protein [Candidatus Pacearchaeota archaeon]